MTNPDMLVGRETDEEGLIDGDSNESADLDWRDLVRYIPPDRRSLKALLEDMNSRATRVIIKFSKNR